MVGTTPGAPGGDAASEDAPPRLPAANLFTGMPPLLMLALGVVIGAAISFALGVVFWSVFA
ncbi:MAG: hypothetical protein ABSE52_05730 [Candidatus Dormibacteria bacterium]